jgi:RimJ/RimL family protein N-acetyltransferase
VIFMSEHLPRVELAAWTEDDFRLLELTNTPEMTDHLGGPETPEALAARHRRYLELPKGGMFTVATADGETAGAIGFWEREWRGGPVWETGWSVLPAFQGRGIAAAAAREIVRVAREADGNRYLHAFPGVDHPASNAVCRKAGFELLEEVSFEYPKGSWMTCNDWRTDLQTPPGA